MTALTATRDHALKMAGKSTTTAADAAVWLQIANEIDAHLERDSEPNNIPADVTPGPDDVPLFEEPQP